VYPQRIPDLFTGKPLVLMGRYDAPGNGTIHLRGKRNGEDFMRDIPVTLSASGQRAIVLPTLWARQKVDDLMSQDWAGAQHGAPRSDVKDAVTKLGLDYRMMTQYTSFVAVEEQVVTKDGQPRTLQVPVEMPEGVSYEGVFGEADGPNMQMASNLSYAAKAGSALGLSASMPRASRAMAPPPITNPATGHDKGKEQAGDRKTLESKLHPALLEVWDCWQKTPNKCAFVQDGKVKIQIWLTTDSQTVLDRLKALGFELIVHRSGEKTVVGKLAVAQVQALSRLAEVKVAGLVKR
jgi:Ca-activated chloride channel family protein